MHFALPLVVFTSGAVVMILELTASRIIAPYLGTSVIVWTSLIGVILAAISIGNWMGGRIADKYPAPSTLVVLLLSSSALIAIGTQFQWLLAAISAQMGLQAAATLGVLLLFGPATAALGTIAPFVVKSSLIDLEGSGRIVGKLYALSNAGSILGTFLGGFILISYLGSGRILTILSIALALLAALVLFVSRSWPPKTVWAGMPIIALALMPTSGSIILAQQEKLMADVDTRYSRTWIVDQELDGGTVRTLRNSIAGYQSGMLMEYPKELLFGYTRMFDLFEAFKPDVKSALMIGGSAYTYPRHFLAKDPDRRATVLEIDPGVTELARTYFGLTDDPRLQIIHEDGRTYLNRSNTEFDVVIIDAFNSDNSIPFHLATREAVSRVADNLTQNGVVMVNIISSLTGSASGFFAAEYATYREVFPYVRVYKVYDIDDTQVQNIILIASENPLVHGADSPYHEELVQKEWVGEARTLPALTDDFAPVERYMNAF